MSNKRKMPAKHKPAKELVTPLPIAQPIVLIGLMGAGKSTIGRRLAARTGRQFVDSDDEIEEAAGCSIADIFAIHGEKIFRDLEQRVIKRLLDQPNTILATGGGAWMQPLVRELIHNSAISLWLNADLEILLSRVEKRNHRPLLEQGDKREILSKLMEERYPIYAEATLSVDSSNAPHHDVVERIIETLTEHSAKGKNA